MTWGVGGGQGGGEWAHVRTALVRPGYIEPRGRAKRVPTSWLDDASTRHVLPTTVALHSCINAR